MAANSPLDSSFVPECELFYEDGPDSPQLKHGCTKNPGHPTFFPISQLKMEDLPEEFQYPKMMDYINKWRHSTVKAIVAYTSKERPLTYPGTDDLYPFSDIRGSNRVTRCGTGYLSPVNAKHQGFIAKPCPCPVCVQSDEPQFGYLEVHVITATHVVYDSLEAQQAKFECYYDLENKDGVKTIYGMGCHSPHENSNRQDTDRCCVFCVTHDREFGTKWYESLRNIVHLDIGKELRSTGFMISHPHGGIKCITFGKAVFYTKVVVSGVRTYTLQGDVRCRLPLFPWSRYDNKENTSPDDYNLNMTPGTEVSLPSPITITISPKEKDLCTSYFEDKQWYSFPTGTTFSYPDGENVFFPPEAVFKSRLLSHSDRPYCLWKGYVTYDIDSCKGSSGAAVNIIDDSSLALHANFSHTGGFQNGLNRSGVALIDYVTDESR